MDWPQLRNGKCPKCLQPISKSSSLLEPSWSCVCGFFIGIDAYTRILSGRLHKHDVKDPLFNQKEREMEHEEDADIENYLPEDEEN